MKIFGLTALLISATAGAEVTTMAVGGYGAKHHLLSSAGFYNIGLLTLGDLKLDGQVGGRLTYFSGQKHIYQTANTRDRVDNGIEKLELKGTAHTAINSAIGFEVEYTPWGIGAGFNIDVYGYSYAPKKTLGDVTLDGSSVNVLRNAYNDIGSLYSEFFVSKRINSSGVSIKAGTTHSVTQYRAQSELGGYRTRRFSNFSDTFIVGAAMDYE